MFKESFKNGFSIQTDRNHVFFAIFRLQIQFEEKFMVLQKIFLSQNNRENILNMIQAIDFINTLYSKSLYFSGNSL